ncbi:MAG: T9SS type A sorting domain-containing protein [Chromatiales bacterium]|nr:T9SS type A sorting domain-containing protein [Chromatiales bacterium]
MKYELPGIADNQLIVFEIIDIYGRTVACMNSFTKQGELDLSGLTSGAYIVKIKTDNGVLTKIVIKE